MSAIFGPRDLTDRLREEGVRTVADVLDRATCVRDLADRSNHVLEVGGLRIQVKRRRGEARPREAEALEQLHDLRVPTARLAFSGTDPEHGAVTGTLDLAPARPLDDLLREGALAPPAMHRVAHALADCVGTLHAAGLQHRDLYLCHVFVHVRRHDVRLALIDLERLRRHRRALGPRVVKDLAALSSSVPEGTVDERVRLRFLLRYLARRGLPIRGVHQGLARRIRRKASRIRRHVPRTPVGEAAPRGDAAS